MFFIFLLKIGNIVASNLVNDKRKQKKMLKASFGNLTGKQLN